MRKALLIIGIIVFVACGIALLMALLFNLGYYNVMDGSTELYHRLRSSVTVSLITGIVLALIGTACFIIRSKI